MRPLDFELEASPTRVTSFVVDDLDEDIVQRLLRTVSRGRSGSVHFARTRDGDARLLSFQDILVSHISHSICLTAVLPALVRTCSPTYRTPLPL